jgi:RecA/RadA recombinase
VYASSIVVAMKKLKLKTDADGNKTSQVHGIRAACKVMKTRYAKPFEGVQVEIPYETGMNPYSGVFDLLEAKGMLKKQGNRYAYTTLDGEEILEYRKNWTGDLLDKAMADFARKEAEVVNTSDNVADDIVEEIVEE